MAILKFRDAGEWKSIAAFKGEDGKDGAIQYKPGYGIHISEDNVISSTVEGGTGESIVVDDTPVADSTNAVSSGGVFSALGNKADKSEIPTDTGDLKSNSAGYITSNDLPKDLGDLDNTAGFLKEESDPLFKKSTAYKLTEDHLASIADAAELTLVPITLALNFNTATVYNFSYYYTDAGIYNKIIKFAGSLRNAIVCIITNSKSCILHYHSDSYTNSYVYHDYWGYVPTDEYGHRIAVRLRIAFNRSSGTHYRTTISTLSKNYQNPTESEVLTKTNTTAFTPTADYHPATKKYVDDQIAVGVEGIGGIKVEEDPHFMNSAAATITEEDIIRWDNKADSGGIDEELDPTVPSWVKEISENDIASWHGKAEKSDIPDVDNIVDNKLNNSGFLTEEKEPAFNGSAAAGITKEDIDNWNAKPDRSEINSGAGGIVVEEDPIFSRSYAAQINHDYMLRSIKNNVCTNINLMLWSTFHSIGIVSAKTDLLFMLKYLLSLSPNSLKGVTIALDAATATDTVVSSSGTEPNLIRKYLQVIKYRFAGSVYDPVNKFNVTCEYATASNTKGNSGVYDTKLVFLSDEVYSVTAGFRGYHYILNIYINWDEVANVDLESISDDVPGNVYGEQFRAAFERLVEEDYEY